MDIGLPVKSRANNLFPYFLLLVAMLGVSITILLKRIDLTISSLVVVVPLVLASLILIADRQISPARLVLPTLTRLHFSHLFLINTLVFIISILVLIAFPTRPLAYFILIPVYSGVLLLQILSRRPGWTTSLILLQIVLLSLNLLWGVTLKYPLYFLDTDSLGHLRMIDDILKTAHVDTYMITYQHYPLYHIFNAVGVEITGLAVRTTLFILMGLAWQAGILFAFLLFRDLTRSGKFALVACLLFASSAQIVFYGSYAIARSLAFVFLLLWLFLIVKKAQKDSRYFFLSLIAMSAMIMTHHVNILLFVPVLILAYICQFFITRSSRERPFEPLFIVLAAVSGLAYLVWVASDMTGSILPGTIRGLLDMDSGLSDDFTRGYGLSVLLGALYYSFILLLCLLGMRIVFSLNKGNPKQRTAGIFALAGLPLLLVYVPGFVELIPASDAIFARRLQLMVTPFIAILAACGISYLFSRRGAPASGLPHISAISALAVVLVAGMTGLSMISIGNAQDYDDLPHTATIDTPYFTDPELNSFSFLAGKANPELPLYTDFQTLRNEFMLGEFTVKRTFTGGDTAYIQEGYMALRTAELERKTALSFSTDGRGRQSFRYQVDPAHPETGILTSLETRNKIFSNNHVLVYCAD